MDHLICCRTTAGTEFADEVGTLRYLAVPENEPRHRPAHQIKLKPWIDAVTQMAETGINPVSGHPEGDVLFFVHGYNTTWARPTCCGVTG